MIVKNKDRVASEYEVVGLRTKLRQLHKNLICNVNYISISHVAGHVMFSFFVLLFLYLASMPIRSKQITQNSPPPPRPRTESRGRRVVAWIGGTSNCS